MGADPSTPGTARAAGTVAVVLATTPVAGLPCPGGVLLDRLTRQLRSLPVRDVHVVVRADGVRRHDEVASEGLAEDLRFVAKVARAATSPLVVIPGDVIAHTAALAALLDHPSRPTGGVVGKGDPAPLHPPVRIEHGRVVSAGNSFHEVRWANGTFRGVLQVGEAHLASLADVAEELAELAQDHRLGRVSDAEAADLLLAGLVRAGVPVQAVEIGALRCERASGKATADAAIRALTEVDEARARLEAAVKTDDGFFATFCVSSWSRYLVRPAAWLGLTPNAVTGISVGLAAIAAIWFSDGDRLGRVVGAVALYLSFVFDCADGQLARYTRRFSPFGGWLDAMCDRGKEYLVYVGLVLGFPDPAQVWPLAVAAMILQALRHMVDFAYAGSVADTVRAGGAPGPPRAPLAVPWDGSAARTGGTSVAGSILALSKRLDGVGADRGAARRSTVHWLKKIIVLPIGERMALIAVTAALFDARVTFLALLGWGGVALAYTLAGRVVRSIA